MESVRAQFEAMLLEPLMHPLADAFGDYGDLAVSQFAQALSHALSSELHS